MRTLWVHLTKSPSVKKARIWSESSAVRLRWAPPGKIIDERCNTASCRELMSTRQRLSPTSTIRPTTTSPTSPVYLLGSNGARCHTERTRRSRAMHIVPAIEWPHRNELVHTLDKARYRGNQLCFLHARAMATVEFKGPNEQKIKLKHSAGYNKRTAKTRHPFRWLGQGPHVRYCRRQMP